ncbi:tubulin polyglutamylase ttll6-like isoform X2 [Arctopsyche grandis]|uniref:tubulin polyglutamylase ttll6-like isoform X2 n=1 Tax=Arctopsyche grandis TaxID=121162 RepID=UPI00406D6BCB
MESYENVCQNSQQMLTNSSYTRRSAYKLVAALPQISSCHSLRDSYSKTHCASASANESPYFNGIFYPINIHTKNVNNEKPNCTINTESNKCDKIKYLNSTNYKNWQMPNLDNNLNNVQNGVDNSFYQTDDTVIQKKKKRRRPVITVCTSNSRFDVIRRVTSAFGMKAVHDKDDWNICFTDGNVTIEKSKEMKRFQRINHFPGMAEICRKDLLARNLNRMNKCFPHDYNFFPKTWCLPSDFNDALIYSKYHKNKTFIIKPDCGSQGKGIFLTKHLKDINPSEKLICQLYITRPYLINGYKFDIRVYALVSSCDPLSIFVYNEGLVRFATTRYCDPNSRNCTNIFMHLTNYAINKQSRFFVYDQESGSKRKISTLNHLLEINGINTKKIWNNVDEIVAKTLISAWPILKHNYRACFASHDTTQACFEILGFDILLDHNLLPHLLEVNHSPSFNTDSLLDKEVKEALLTDTLSLLNIWQCDKRKILEEDRKRIQERLLHGYKNNYDVIPLEEKDEVKEKEKQFWQEQLHWEDEHLGNYRRVYPNGDKYSKFFQQPSSSLYLSTTSSRARGECVKRQRSLIEAKEKLNMLKRLPSLNSPSVNKDLKVYDTQIMKQRLYKNHEKKLRPDMKLTLPKIVLRETALCGLPDGLPIIESEEKKRILELDKRDTLLKNNGITEIVYNTMRQVGVLRPADEKKYATYHLSRNP